MAPKPFNLFESLKKLFGWKAIRKREGSFGNLGSSVSHELLLCWYDMPQYAVETDAKIRVGIILKNNAYEVCTIEYIYIL